MGLDLFVGTLGSDKLTVTMANGEKLKITKNASAGTTRANNAKVLIAYDNVGEGDVYYIDTWT